MADHLDAPGLKSPNMDAEIDITDHYAFQKPGDPNKSILVFNVNPLAPTLADSFEHEAVYEIKVDTDADAVAEIAFRITFSPKVNGRQTATVRRAVGANAAGNNNGGQVIINHAPVNFDSSITITKNGGAWRKLEDRHLGADPDATKRRVRPDRPYGAACDQHGVQPWGRQEYVQSYRTHPGPGALRGQFCGDAGVIRLQLY